MDFQTACRKIISLDSSAEQGTAEVCQFVLNLANEMGLKGEVLNSSAKGPNFTNFLCKLPGSSEQGALLLSAHLDTGEPGHNAYWPETDQNPFNCTLKDGKFFGLGAANAKLDFLCQLFALSQFAAVPLKRSLCLLGTHSEEMGMTGASEFMEMDRVKVWDAIVATPTQESVVFASNGMTVLDISIPFPPEEALYRRQHDQQESSSSQSRIFKGKSVHSSNPLNGENALIKVVRHIAQLPAGLAIMNVDGGIAYNVVPNEAFLEVDATANLKESVGRKIVAIVGELERIATEFVKYQFPEMTPPTPTWNLGTIRSGEAEIRLGISFRIPPSTPAPVYRGWVLRLREFCASLDSKIEPKVHTPPHAVDRKSQLYLEARSTCRELTSKSEPVAVPHTNETSVFSKFDVNCIAYGAGENFGRSVKGAEYVSLAALERTILFYKKMIERLCL